MDFDVVFPTIEHFLYVHIDDDDRERMKDRERERECNVFTANMNQTRHTNTRTHRDRGPRRIKSFRLCLTRHDQTESGVRENITTGYSHSSK